MSEPPSTQAWLSAHGIPEAISTAIKQVLSERPPDPVAAVGRALLAQQRQPDARAGGPDDKSARVERDYAAGVRYIFDNADFSGLAKRYQNPQANWERFEEMLKLLGQPMRKLKVVHIAGTNGKGTTSALCDAMLRASTTGRVGLFTSPHLHCFRERIRIDGQLTTKAEIVEALDVVRPVAEAVGGASPFEKLTALALVCFVRAGCEWAVLETGLGGRWDCTNHAKPLVCGVTRIGYDHMNVLGGTIAKIAGEKAGILKKGVPAFCVPQEADALAVLQRTAREQGAPLALVDASADAPADGGGAASTARRPRAAPFWLTPVHQAHNAAMALAMLHSLYERGHLAGMAPASCAAAAARARWLDARDATSWPCRFEVLRPSTLLPSGAPLVLDVAHNEPAVEALVRSAAAAWRDAPCVVIFGANFDKDVAKCVRLLCAHPRLVGAVAVQSSHPKAVPTDQILREAAGASASAPPPAGKAATVAWQAAASMAEAVERAAAILRAAPRGPPLGAGASGVVLCCGSVFVAADMREALAERQPDVFASGDWVFARESVWG